MEDSSADNQKNHEAAFVDDADYGSQTTATPQTAQTPSQPLQSPSPAQPQQQTQQQQPQQSKKQSHASVVVSDDQCNLIINYIPMSYNEERLKTLFSAYGTIESCKLMIDKSTSKDFFFLKFNN